MESLGVRGIPKMSNSNESSVIIPVAGCMHVRDDFDIRFDTFIFHSGRMILYPAPRQAVGMMPIIVIHIYPAPVLSAPGCILRGDPIAPKLPRPRERETICIEMLSAADLVMDVRSLDSEAKKSARCRGLARSPAITAWRTVTVQPAILALLRTISALFPTAVAIRIPRGGGRDQRSAHPRFTRACLIPPPAWRPTSTIQTHIARGNMRSRERVPTWLRRVGIGARLDRRVLAVRLASCKVRMPRSPLPCSPKTRLRLRRRSTCGGAVHAARGRDSGLVCTARGIPALKSMARAQTMKIQQGLFRRGGVVVQGACMCMLASPAANPSRWTRDCTRRVINASVMGGSMTKRGAVAQGARARFLLPAFGTAVVASKDLPPSSLRCTSQGLLTNPPRCLFRATPTDFSAPLPDPARIAAANNRGFSRNRERDLSRIPALDASRPPPARAHNQPTF